MPTLARLSEPPDSSSMEEPPDPPPQPEIIIEPDKLAGLWSNWAQVYFSDHEFTIDFVRLDPNQPRGIVVSRVSGSALFIMQLIDTLHAAWQDWAKKAMPEEVHGADGDEQAPDSSPT